MIFESQYWKSDLLKLSRKLIRTKSKDFFNDVNYEEFEKGIIVGFFILRRLKESYNLSNATIATNIPGRKIPSNGRALHLMNIHIYEECFDFRKIIVTKFDLPFLINQMIHSYFFSAYFLEPSFDLAGIHFCSDKNRNQWLYEIEIDTIISLFTRTGNDYPVDMEMRFDNNKLDYKIFQQ